MFNVHIGLDEPAEYLIKVQGRLNGDLADWFHGPVRIDTETSGPGETITVLTGIVADQSALHGLIRRIRDLGLPLLLVDCVSGRRRPGA